MPNLNNVCAPLAGDQISLLPHSEVQQSYLYDSLSRYNAHYCRFSSAQDPVH